jgi:hypothetical protein
MNITWIIVGVLSVVSVVITYFVIPYLKSKKTTEEWVQIVEKANLVTKWIITAVNAAEMFFKGVGLGAEKNSYVLAFVKTLCEKFGMTFDEDVVSAEIEEVGQDLGLWGVAKNETDPE